jgi:hypothetical protein
MKLPHAQQAYIAEAKIVEYLLNLAHTAGGKDKAVFFMRFGFTLDAWRVLERALLDHVLEHDVASRVINDASINYAVDGILITPDGRNPTIRTVWALDNDSKTPRFVTAYPLK